MEGRLVHLRFRLSVRKVTQQVFTQCSYFPVLFSGHEYPIWCIDESSNGCYAATGSRDTTARLWSYERKFPVKVYAGHTQDVDVRNFVNFLQNISNVLVHS